jgi:hypothetical protein
MPQQQKSKPKPKEAPVRDSDYYRRLGGYQGKYIVKPIEVGCSTCDAVGGENCEGVKTFHRERRNFAAELTEKANSDLPIARWYRSEFRAGRFPKPKMPCGTYGAYLRHKRAGQTIDEMDQACQDAAREYWRLAKTG